MNTLKSILLVVCIHALAVGVCQSATPAQAGLYNGTMVTTSVASDGSKTKTKSTLLLQIGLDDSTTVTINGLTVPQSDARFLANDGIHVFADLGTSSGYAHLVSWHFKKKSLKGVAVGYTTATVGEEPDQETVFIAHMTSKIKLKKLF